MIFAKVGCPRALFLLFGDNSMNIDASNLNKETFQYMISKGLTESTTKVDDGGWERSGLLYFIEEKSEWESILPQSSWWKWDNDTLLGQRDIIRNNYRSSNRLEFHQNKWMIAIAQLRKGVLRLQGVGKDYCAIFSIPSVEINNFQHGFQRYHLDRSLNTNSCVIGVGLDVWKPNYSYNDQRGIQINVNIIEIEQHNYFGTI